MTSIIPSVSQANALNGRVRLLNTWTGRLALPRRRRPHDRGRGQARRRDRRGRPAPAVPGTAGSGRPVRADRRDVRRATDQAPGPALRREQGRGLRRDRPGAPAGRLRPRAHAVLRPRPADRILVRAVLLLQCPDRPGIVAGVGAFVAEAGGNIIEADQHSDPVAGLFLQRIEFDVDATPAHLAPAFAPLAEQYAMHWEVYDLAAQASVALLASRQGHCLADLLVRFELGEMPARALFVASNHDTQHATAERFGLPFYSLPVRGDDRDAQERALGEL